jgi:hypothetical protein
MRAHRNCAPDRTRYPHRAIVLTRFAAEYPKVRLVQQATNRNVDLIDEALMSPSALMKVHCQIRRSFLLRSSGVAKQPTLRPPLRFQPECRYDWNCGSD